MKRSEMTFHFLYKKYAQDVLRFAFWLCADEAEAKDITSETFVRVWTSDKTPRTETVKGYLFTIARNIYLKNRVRKKRFFKIEESKVTETINTEHEIENRLQLETVLKAIKRLPESDRLVLTMRANENMSHKEISSVTGFSISSIKVKLHRARKKLNQILNERT